MSDPDATINIIRTVKDREHPYVMVNKSVFEDTRLSWEARGLLGYLLSKPDNWSVRFSHLLKQGHGGRDRLYRMLKELQTYGYLTRTPQTDQTGRFTGWVTRVYETPQPLPEKADVGISHPLPEKPEVAPLTPLPDTVQPDTEKPYYGKAGSLISNDYLPNTEVTNNGGEGAAPPRHTPTSAPPPADGFDELTPARQARQERAALAAAAPRPIRCPRLEECPATFQDEVGALLAANPHITADHVSRAVSWFRQETRRQVRLLSEWLPELRAVVLDEIDKWRPTAAPRAPAKGTNSIPIIKNWN
jgi:hypothetical protein